MVFAISRTFFCNRLKQLREFHSPKLELLLNTIRSDKIKVEIAFTFVVAYVMGYLISFGLQERNVV